MPCFMPLLQSPSYSAPERKQYLPYPLISSSMKHPEYFQPDWQWQSPHPFFMPYSIQPSQRSPFLYFIRNFLLPRSYFSISSYSFSTSSELFVCSSCSAGTSSRISVFYYYLCSVIGSSLIYSYVPSSSFLGLVSFLYVLLDKSWPKNVRQSILVSLKNSVAYQLNSYSPISSLIFKISLSSMASPPSPIKRSRKSAVGRSSCWQMVRFSSPDIQNDLNIMHELNALVV